MCDSLSSDAVIEKTSLPFAKRVLKITPPVPRRRGWDESDESCVFHIRFKTEKGRNEVGPVAIATVIAVECPCMVSYRTGYTQNVFYGIMNLSSN